MVIRLLKRFPQYTLVITGFSDDTIEVINPQELTAENKRLKEVVSLYRELEKMRQK